MTYSKNKLAKVYNFINVKAERLLKQQELLSDIYLTCQQNKDKRGMADAAFKLDSIDKQFKFLFERRG